MLWGDTILSRHIFIVTWRMEKMKFEYRYLSEERAAEINAMRIITPDGHRLGNVNYAKCITNEDETIVFQQVFVAVPHANDNIVDIDQYILFYRGYRYVLDIDELFSRKEENGEVKYHSKWIIESKIADKQNCPSEEVLSILIEILCEKSRHIGLWDMIIEGTVEIIYMGEKICG